jgi:hypothetical protein
VTQFRWSVQTTVTLESSGRDTVTLESSDTVPLESSGRDTIDCREVGCTGPALYGVVPPTLQGRTHFPPILFSRLLFRLRDFTKLLVGILPTKKRKEYMAIIDVS